MKTYAIRSALLAIAVNPAFLWLLAQTLGWHL